LVLTLNVSDTAPFELINRIPLFNWVFGLTSDPGLEGFVDDKLPLVFLTKQDPR